MPSHPPNVVILVLDSVRRDHLSCYGHTRETTPNIDRIAAEGTLYRGAYAASCWTIPTHASLFTGLYPSRHGADIDTMRLPPGVPTLASYLSEHGYASASFSCNGFISSFTELTRGFDLSVDMGVLAGGAKGLLPRAVRAIHRRWRDWTAQDRGTRKACRAAEQWISRQEKGKPFFLFVNLMDCHLPYWLRGESRYRYVAKDARKRVDAVPQDPFAVMANSVSVDAADLTDLRDLYDGALRYMDSHVGSIYDRLDRLRLLDDTLFVVTSDHGESFGERGLMDHQYALHEPLIKVPLVVRYPKPVKIHGPVDDLVQHTDLFATISDLVTSRHGGPSAAPQDSVSMVGRTGRDRVFAEYRIPNLRAFKRRFPAADVSRFDTPLRCVVHDGMKLVQRSDGGAELYDLSADSAELRDLSHRRPDLRQRLMAELDAALGPWKKQPLAWRDDDGLTLVRDRLEALGYL